MTFIFKEVSMSAIDSPAAFKEFVSAVESTEGYRQPIGFGLCRIDRGQLDPQKILACSFPVINWRKNFGSAAVFQKAAGLTDYTYTSPEIIVPISHEFIGAALETFAPFISEAQGDKHRNVQVIQALAKIAKSEEGNLADYRLVFIYEDAPPESVPAIYLKLIALSTGDAPLRGLNLTGIFGKLENVAWVDGQPFELDYLRQHEIDMKLAGTFPAIQSVDKFPRYLHHIIPDARTRILDDSRVRLGAQLAPGTTVMPGASYINFNSGTLGTAMVEGRISSSVVVGKDTDIGGGASILGVLSGGNSTPITIGERCLLGANSVTGIPLGDGCIVDAGVAVLAGTRVFVDSASFEALRAVNPGLKSEGSSRSVRPDILGFKAAALSGCHGMHFRVDSETGRHIVKRSTKEIALNRELHGTKPQ
jgi:2,3,4,5-tetrahydropyridine-2-carboxylate N-succinyltransferase